MPSLSWVLDWTSNGQTAVEPTGYENGNVDDGDDDDGGSDEDEDDKMLTKPQFR